VKHYIKPPMDLFGSVSVAWLTPDWSVTGVFGDATAGNPDKGIALMDSASNRLAKVIIEMSKFEVENV
jgi:creatinine amidohydrolase/Fe(II)-dependent formamide hydrolase-like protein